MINQRTRAKNQFHAMLAYYNLISPLTDLFGASGHEFLDECLPALRPTERRVVRDCLDLIDHLNQNIEDLEDAIEQPGAKLALTVPGHPQREPPYPGEKITLSIAIPVFLAALAALVGLGAKELFELDFQKFLGRYFNQLPEPVFIITLFEV